MFARNSCLLLALLVTFVGAGLNHTELMGQEIRQMSPAALYYHPKCSHCIKVKNYLNSINKTIPMKSTANPRYRNELNALGQKGVPTLVVGSRVIVGADPIISYLKQHPEVLN